jgi:hypothetical protein
VPEPLVITGRFNGPTASGNGGYASGTIASFLGGVAAVSLRRPIPLDKPLEVSVEDGSARVVDDETLIAEAQRVDDFAIEPPAPVGLEEAREASASYRGLPDGQFSKCFVCGLARDDSFGVFAGEVAGRDAVASPWTPPRWTAGEDGWVKPEFIWSVLDCPTYFATYLREDLATSFLVQMTARIDSPVAAGEEHVVMAWPIDVDGRKRWAGSAVVRNDGEVLALARALLIEPRS